MNTNQHAETPRAPGPGSWEIDLTHFPRPATPIAERIYSTSFREGFRIGSARYGVLLDHLAYAAASRATATRARSSTSWPTAPTRPAPPRRRRPRLAGAA